MIQIENRGSKKVLTVDGKPYFLLAGEVHNSDSSSPAYMERIWELGDSMGMNVLLLPVTWEMIEPEEGHFDFSVPQALIEQARKEICISFFCGLAAGRMPNACMPRLG